MLRTSLQLNTRQTKTEVNGGRGFTKVNGESKKQVCKIAVKGCGPKIFINCNCTNEQQTAKQFTQISKINKLSIPIIVQLSNANGSKSQAAGSSGSQDIKTSKSNIFNERKSQTAPRGTPPKMWIHQEPSFKSSISFLLKYLIMAKCTKVAMYGV